jgi:hypothetical protein
MLQHKSEAVTTYLVPKAHVNRTHRSDVQFVPHTYSECVGKREQARGRTGENGRKDSNERLYSNNRRG